MNKTFIVKTNVKTNNDGYQLFIVRFRKKIIQTFFHEYGGGMSGRNLVDMQKQIPLKLPKKDTYIFKDRNRI